MTARSTTMRSPSRDWSPRRCGCSASATRKPLDRGCNAAGIETRLTPHGLPRTLNSIALQVAPGEVVRKITGHTTADMTAHYFAQEMAAKRRLLGKVVSLVQKADVGIQGASRVTE